MRQGKNPLRTEKAPYTIKDIVFVVVTHLPNNDGYHLQRFEVIKACLESMRKNAHKDHTFYVFDNGSHEAFRDWLYNEFKPDMLTLSHNIGKTAARTTAIQSLPMGSIVCYSDDDILYYPNWLQPQIDILNHFQGASIVSGNPIRTSFRWATGHAIHWAKEHNALIEKGRFISDEYEKDFCKSIERDWAWHKSYTEKDVDIKIKWEGKEAYTIAHHCQFIGYVVNLLRALVYDGMAMGDEKPFDEALDQIGPRLCTTERLSRHIGNKIDEDMRNEIEKVMNEPVPQ